MPKKRGRPPKKQQPAKRGPGRPRKSAETPRVQPRRRRTRTRADIAVAAAPTVQQYTPSKPYVVPVVYDEGTTPVFKPVEPVEHDAKFQMPPPRPNCDNLEDVVMALTRVYLPDRFIMKVFGNILQPP